MFFCILRRQDALIKSMREDHAQFKALLRSVQSRLEPVTGSDGEVTESPLHAPLSVEQALGAYSSQRLDMEPPHSAGHAKSGMPDLKF